MRLGQNKAYKVVYLLGLALIGYLVWQAHLHMQKSTATQVLLAQAHQSNALAATPKLPLTEAFLAGALDDEPIAGATQEAVVAPALVPAPAEATSLAKPAGAVDKPMVQKEQVVPMTQASQTRKSSKRHTTTKEHSKTNGLRLTVHPPPALAHDKLLRAAYQAYQYGDEVAAQKLYQQVLESDSTNLDAMLGMAVMAQRQGQETDAADWYQSVLMQAPKNSLALLATLPMQDKAYAENRIRELLHTDPNAAYLHAALANLLAGQGLWSAAEAAYFDASQLAPHRAEYAFNLAVCLEHMGHAALAIEQYERALALLKPSASDSLSKQAIETRINALK